MRLDDDLKQQFEQCDTLDELKSALRYVIASHGQESSDRMVKGVLLGFCGGTVVQVDAQGQPLNRWRRKFFPAGSTHLRRRGETQPQTETPPSHA